MSEMPQGKNIVAAKQWLRKVVDFRAQNSGLAKLEVGVTSNSHRDFKQEKMQVLPHGILKSRGFSGRLQGKAVHKLTLPPSTDLTESRVVVRVLPGFLAAIQESVNMLLEYPYGCAEQTMSRFMPNIVAHEMLQKVQMDVATLKKNVGAGVERLTQLQNADGGWGWWRNDQVSHPMLSAYVAFGLVCAKDFGYVIDDRVLERGCVFLTKVIETSQLSYATKAYIVYALSRAKKLPNGLLDRVFDQQQRLQADSYTLSLLALTFVNEGRKVEAKVLGQQITQKIQFSGDSLPFWGDIRGISWNKNAVEVTAMAARALLAINPKNKMIPPALEWLMAQRKNRGWYSTKDTAEVVLTFCSYLETRGFSTNSPVSVHVKVNNQSQQLQVGNVAAVQTFTDLKMNNEFSISSDSDHLYYSVYVEYLTTEKKIAATTNGIEVKRSYYTLVKKGDTYDKVPFTGEVSPEDIVMVALEVVCDQSRDFVMLEDYLPASANVITKDRHMPNMSDISYTHREFHDEKTLFFFTNLQKGSHQVHYFFRPSLAGKFHALPAIVSLMYYPEIRGNSAETVFTVK